MSKGLKEKRCYRLSFGFLANLFSKKVKMSLIQNGGVGIFCLDKTLTANNSATIQPTFIYQSNSCLGIGTSNPQSVLDVSGDVSSSNLYLRGNFLELTGGNPLPGYCDIITTNFYPGELSIAGYTTNQTNFSRKVVVYENLYVAGNLYQQNNANTNYVFSQTGSNGNGLQLCQSYGQGAYCTSANPGDSVIRTQGNAQLFIQNGNGSPAMTLSNNVVNFNQPVSFQSTSSIQVPSSGTFNIQNSSGTTVISISGNTVTIPSLVTSSPITPSISYNNSEYYYIAPNAISAFLYSAGNTYTNTVTTYSIPTPFFNCPNSTWECGNDASSTPVTYKYARFVMNAFTSSGGNATSQNSVQCQILFKNASGVLVAYPDQGTTYFNIVDQGTSYGYCVSVSPWYLAVQGIGSPVFQNLDSSRTIQVGSTTMQFR